MIGRYMMSSRDRTHSAFFAILYSVVSLCLVAGEGSAGGRVGGGVLDRAERVVLGVGVRWGVCARAIRIIIPRQHLRVFFSELLAPTPGANNLGHVESPLSLSPHL